MDRLLALIHSRAANLSGVAIAFLGWLEIFLRAGRPFTAADAAQLAGLLLASAGASTLQRAAARPALQAPASWGGGTQDPGPHAIRPAGDGREDAS